MANGSANVFKLDMQRLPSNPNLAVLFTFPWSFYVVIFFQRTAKKCTKIYNACAQLLFVVLVACFTSLKELRTKWPCNYVTKPSYLALPSLAPFFLPDRPTHLHEREGDGKRNISWGWPYCQNNTPRNLNSYLSFIIGDFIKPYLFSFLVALFFVKITLNG